MYMLSDIYIILIYPYYHYFNLFLNITLIIFNSIFQNFTKLIIKNNNLTK